MPLITHQNYKGYIFIRYNYQYNYDNESRYRHSYNARELWL